MALHAHPLIRDMAMKLAEEWFEVYAENNGYYRALKEAASQNGAAPATERRARKLFVARVAPRLFEEARLALVDVLAQPDVPESTKERVMEALAKDNLMRANRTVAKHVATVPKRLH